MGGSVPQMVQISELSHCCPIKYEAEVHSKESFSVFCVCVQRDVCRERPGLNQIICESMQYVVGKNQYVEMCLQGRTRINPGCSRTKKTQSGLSRRSKEGRDKRMRSQ